MKKIIALILMTTSLNLMAHYTVVCHEKDSITMTKDGMPEGDCVLKGSYNFQSKTMSRDENGIIKEAKLLGGNFVKEIYDNYPSLRHMGDVYYCKNRNSKCP